MQFLCLFLTVSVVSPFLQIQFSKKDYQQQFTEQVKSQIEGLLEGRPIKVCTQKREAITARTMVLQFRQPVFGKYSALLIYGFMGYEDPQNAAVRLVRNYVTPLLKMCSGNIHSLVLGCAVSASTKSGALEMAAACAVTAFEGTCTDS